ncbi:MAG: ureidoglycolate hydrolase [Alphaproteobacteria bacterium]|nr:ureidoglycolate hydrolase [Alphaproteobacteria bacterium]
MLLAVAPEAGAFAPFGALIEPPPASGARRMLSDWILPVPGLALQFHINHVAATPLPARLEQLERHPHSAQAFVPMDVSRYLVTVAPKDGDGQPDLARALCFLMPGNLGVIYRKDVWHAGITVLDRPGAFAVLMWRGAADDDVMAEVTPSHIALPAKTRLGTSS